MTGIYKDIHIGKVMSQLVQDYDIQSECILNFFDTTEDVYTHTQMCHSAFLDTENLLKWSKLLDYDLFRLYSNHLMLHHGVYSKGDAKQASKESTNFHFSKNLYTLEVIEYIVELLQTKQMSIPAVMKKYNIPKTT